MERREPTSNQSDPPAGHYFRTTHWSVVLAAGDNTTTPDKEAALEQLCRSYWKPLYTWLRRTQPNLTPQDAEDCLQGFFTGLFERSALARVERPKGKFRSFLCASLENHLANVRTHARAQKRGRYFDFVSWDDEQLEQSIRDATASHLSPDKLLERAWTLALLEHVLARLKAEQAAAGKSDQFDALQVYLSGDKGVTPYADTATRLSLGESAVKMAIQRLRRRFGELLRAEIAHTVSRPEEVDEEIRALFSAVSA